PASPTPHRARHPASSTWRPTRTCAWCPILRALCEGWDSTNAARLGFFRGLGGDRRRQPLPPHIERGTQLLPRGDRPGLALGAPSFAHFAKGGIPRTLRGEVFVEGVEPGGYASISPPTSSAAPSFFHVATDPDLRLVPHPSRTLRRVGFH